MFKKSMIKRLAAGTLAVVFALSLFTSCHRGYGCPNHIGEYPQQVENNC